MACALVPGTVPGRAGMRGPLAQLAEQLTLNQRVRGSSPWRLTSVRMQKNDASGGSSGPLFGV